MPDLRIPSQRLRTALMESKRSHWRRGLRPSSKIPRTWPRCGRRSTMCSCGLRRRRTGGQLRARNRNRARKNDRVSIRSVVQYISLLSYLDSVLLFPFEHFSANPCQVLAAE
uniref:HL03025p n=1 Tax=Drosophila melanogaster TaxID=7227 RepID=Q9VW18_DROME